MKQEPIPHQGPDKAAVLTKAFFRAADRLELTRQDLRDLLGISEPTISRLVGTAGAFSLATKEGEIARLFLRMYRSLDSLFGGDDKNSVAWLQAPNDYLNGTPLQLIKNIGGLVHVTDYLDAMRGKV